MRKRASRPRAAALVCLFIAVVACVLWAARGNEDGRGSRDPSGQGLSTAMEGRGHRGKKSDAEHWLEDLDASTEASPAVEWTENRGMVRAASALLKRYERLDSAVLETQGYLDLKGNVWGAIVSDRKGWVDMVTVMSNEADDEATVRVVRLVADRLDRS